MVAVPAALSAQTTRESVASDGSQANAASSRPAVSSDGRFVVFRSQATNLTAAGPGDLYIRDRQTQVTARVPIVLPPAFEDQFAAVPSVSDDGRYVALRNTLFDRQTGTHITLPAVGTVPVGTETGVLGAVISRDGTRVAYVTNRVPSFGSPGYRTLVVRTLATGATCQYTTPSTFTGLPLFIPTSGPPRLGISADGRWVVFASEAALNELGTGPGGSAYLFDCTTEALVGLGLPNVLGYIAAINPVISGDGRYVGFKYQRLVYVLDRLVNLTRQALDQTRGELSDLAAISDDGRHLTGLGTWEGQPGVYSVDSITRVMRRVDLAIGGASPDATPDPFDPQVAASASGRYAVFASPATNLVTGDTNSAQDIFVRDVFDDDGDTMTNQWETFFGLNPLSPTDAGLDPDGDGSTNAQEFAAGTHPRGVASATRYFAEGASTDFFDTRIAVANPSPTTAASVLLRFVRPDGTFATQLVALPPHHSTQFLVDTLPSMANTSFATVVESDTTVVADRLMWWGPAGAYGTHSERSVGGASLTWHFAEGATHSGFDLFFLLLNPNATASSVRVRYLRPTGAPLERTYTVPAQSRLNIWVDQELFSGAAVLANTDVSAVFDVQNGVPILVERSMYLTPPSGPLFSAGHASAGATSPGNTWFFAEGATGTYFDEYVLIANPGASDSTVLATYLLDSGTTYTKTYAIPAGSRFTIWVDDEAILGQGKPLTNTALSVRLEVVSGPPVVAERSMWWPGPTSATWHESHNVLGATAAAARWGFADGAVAGPLQGNVETYFLISNATTGPATVRLTLLPSEPMANTVSRTYVVPAASRFTVSVANDFPAVDVYSHLFGALVESIDAAPVPIVVERAVYNDAGGVHWAAGTASLGSPLP